MSSVPQEIRDEVVAALYSYFDSVRWELLTSSDKSNAYENLLNNAEVGSILESFMDSGRIRVWIKDGPAKEYGRALEGVGSYAKFTKRAYESPEIVLKKVLGSGWNYIDGSLGEKPMRGIAISSDNEQRFVVWGPASSFKELIWQALCHRVDNPAGRPLVMITRPTIAPLSSAMQAQAERMCEIAGAQFVTVVRATKSKSA